MQKLSFARLEASQDIGIKACGKTDLENLKVRSQYFIYVKVDEHLISHLHLLHQQEYIDINFNQFNTFPIINATYP